ncbi:MAG: hypothetical protein WC551_05520 [Patescibacteria group bacterium]
MPFTELHGHLAKRLFDLGAVKFGAFRLKLHETHPDAPLSPIYLNLRTPSNPKPGPLGDAEVMDVAQEMYALARSQGLGFELASGVPNAGDPFAEAFCRVAAADRGRRHSIGFLILQKEEAADGQRRVTSVRMGAYSKKDRALLIDDSIIHADPAFEAIRVLEQNELKVTDVLVLVDREQGGREELARRGYNLHAVFTLSELLDFYVAACLLTHRKRDEVREYLRTAS